MKAEFNIKIYPDEDRKGCFIAQIHSATYGGVITLYNSKNIKTAVNRIKQEMLEMINES
jgi:hypothetical protein